MFLYSRRYFSRLPQAFSKRLINRLSQKSSYDSMIIDPVINWFIPNWLSVHLHICYHSIITFGGKGFCLGFSNTSYVYNLDSFRKVVVEKFHNFIDKLR